MLQKFLDSINSPPNFADLSRKILPSLTLRRAPFALLALQSHILRRVTKLASNMHPLVRHERGAKVSSSPADGNPKDGRDSNSQ